MRPVQITLDEALIREMDGRLRGKRRARSAFVREALQEHLRKLRIRELDEQHRRGYEKHPVRPGEFDFLYGLRDWGEE